MTSPGLRHKLEDLRAMAAQHVRYELERMAELAVQPSGFTLTDQSVLEAYLLHVRNLHDFLTGQRQRRFPMDVVASDYFDGGWVGRCLAKGEKDEIDRRVAHLTLYRLEGNRPDGAYDWAQGDGRAGRLHLALKTAGAFGTFVTALEEAHPERAAWFAFPTAYARWLLGQE